MNSEINLLARREFFIMREGKIEHFSAKKTPSEQFAWSSLTDLGLIGPVSNKTLICAGSEGSRIT